MKFKAFFSVFIVTLMLFTSYIKLDAAQGNAADNGDSIKKLADEFYTRYAADTEALGSTIMKSSGQMVEAVFKNVEEQLSAYCTAQAVQKYVDRMRMVYEAQEYEPTYAASDDLLKSRVIYLTEKYALVRQYRKITTRDTEWAGKGRTFYAVKYVFLEKSTIWKLRDISDTRMFPMRNDEVMSNTYYTDVTGDSKKDSIYLVERREQPESSYVLAVRVVVNGVSYNLDPGFYSGYSPAVAFYDLNGDGVNDIYISMGTGGSSGASLYYAFTIKSGKFMELLGAKQGTGGAVTPSMKFLDGYNVSIAIPEYNLNMVIDVSSNKQYYEDGGFYVNGKVKDSGIVPVIDPYVSLEPQDVDLDGQSELVGVQYAWGFWHADTLFELRTLLKYRQDKWELTGCQIINLTMDLTDDDLQKAEETAALWGNYVVMREDKKAEALMALGNKIMSISNPHPTAFKIKSSRIEGRTAVINGVIDTGYTAQPYCEKEFIQLKLVKTGDGFLIISKNVTGYASAVEKQAAGAIVLNFSSKPQLTVKTADLPAEMKGLLSAIALDDSLTKMAVTMQDGGTANLTVYDIETGKFSPVEKISNKLISDIYFDENGNLIK